MVRLASDVGLREGALIMVWWYIKEGSQVDWPSGEDLPHDADWSHVDFLNQFVTKAMTRRWAAYAAYMAGTPATIAPVEKGTAVSRAGWLNDFVEICMAYNYYPSENLPATGDSFLGGAYGGDYTETVRGDYVPVLQLTELRKFLDEHSVFGHRGFDVSGSWKHTLWGWDYDRDANPQWFWSTDQVPYWPWLTDNVFGLAFNDKDYWRDLLREGQSIEDAASSFRGTGKEINVNYAYCYVGKTKSGDDPVGGWKYTDGTWAFPGIDKIVVMKDGSGSGSIESDLAVEATPMFAFDLFADYDPTWRNYLPQGPEGDGIATCDFAKFIKVND